MLSKIRLHFFVLLTLFIFQWSIAEAVDAAYFTADKTNPLIGEPVNLSLHIIVPQKAQLNLPDFATEWSGISVTEVGILGVVGQAADGAVEYTLPLTIVLWETGSLDTPTLEISYQIEGVELVTLAVSSIHFEVPATLAPNDLSLRPSKPQISMFYIPRWIIVAFAFVVAVSLYLIMKRSWQSNSRYKSAGNIFASEAVSHLSMLQQLGTMEKSPVKLYQQAAEILRSYIDMNLVQHSLDLTTNELMTHLKREDKLSESQHRQLGEMLKFADKIKFSQVSPESKAGQQFALAAVEWIRSVEERSGRSL